MPIAVKTVRELEAEIVAVIHGLTPLDTETGECEWVHHDDNATLGGRTRLFHLVWSLEGFTPDGFWFAATTPGVQTSANLDIVTDYNVPSQDLAEAAIRDHLQLQRAMYAELVRGATSSSLLSVDSAGMSVDDADDSGDLARVTHSFDLTFMHSWRHE